MGDCWGLLFWSFVWLVREVDEETSCCCLDLGCLGILLDGLYLDPSLGLYIILGLYIVDGIVVIWLVAGIVVVWGFEMGVVL